MENWKRFVNESFETTIVNDVAKSRDLNALLSFSFSANSDPSITKIINSEPKIEHVWTSTELPHAASAFAFVGLKNKKRTIHYMTTAWEEMVYDIHEKYGKAIQEIQELDYREILEKLTIVLFSKTVIHELAHHEDVTHLVSTGVIGDIDVLDKISYNKIRNIALTDPDFLESIENYAFGKELQYSDSLKSSRYQLVKDYVIPEQIPAMAIERLEEILQAFLQDPDYQPSPAALPGTIADYFPEFGDSGE